MKAEKYNKEDITFRDQKIIPVGMEDEVKKSFMAYSMSVIMSRALPDVRDGLKPVHRRILYAMFQDHLTYDRPFRKSAATVGNVLARFHPHGDAAVYDSMVRLAQSFSLRYPLIEGQGNFGNVDGDEAAAYRYTEARMAKLANEMLTDIDKEVVDFVPNFDNKDKEPSVLPSRFPNLLVNGSVGIAVGMATYIPPHNLCEVIDGTIYLMDHPDATVADLMNYIKGPDFPTKATIYGVNGIIEAYTTGRGRVLVRAKAEIEEDKHRIVVTEIPYAVNKSELVQRMAALHREKVVEGIVDIRDESGKNGMRIVIDYRRDINGQVLLNQLYKYTQLQDTCAINMLALVNNVPKVLGLKDILTHYIAHQESVIERRVRFDLAKAEHDAHINEGYKIATDNIDRVIEIIKRSLSIQDAKEKLMEEFSLSAEQAQAIVDMTLGRLSGLERQKVEEKLRKLYEMIKEYRETLADEGKIKEIIKTDMLEIKQRFGDERKTEIVQAEEDIVLEDLIDRHTCVITLTHAGYIKRRPADTYTAQNRGGKGIIGMTTKEEDFVKDVVIANSHSYLLMFTDTGKIHMRKAYQIPEASRTAKGSNIINIIEIEPGEKITSILSVQDFSGEEYLTMITKYGVCKRTPLCEYQNNRKGGKIAIDLDEGDSLVFVSRTTGFDQIMIATAGGNAVKFHEEEARVVGRTARGVRGIRLEENDFVVGATIVDDSQHLLTITEGGYGKRSPFDNFHARSRGTKGVCCHNLSEKTGKLCSIATVREDDDVMLITNEGTIIRMPISQIPVYSRTASGVIVMRLNDACKIVNFAKVGREDNAAEEAKLNETEEIEMTVAEPAEIENENTEEEI